MSRPKTEALRVYREGEPEPIETVKVTSEGDVLRKVEFLSAKYKGEQRRISIRAAWMENGKLKD